MTGEIAAYITRNGTTMVKLTEIDPTSDDSRIYYPRLDEQATYPAVEWQDFGEGLDCKDGLYGTSYTTTAIVWARKMSQVNDIVDKIILDMHHFQGDYYDTHRVITSRMSLLGPIITEEDKKVYGRPVDFEIHLEKL